MKSVLDTQRPVLFLQADIAQAKLRLETMEKNLVPLIEAHRAQIAKSLNSKNPTERILAESIREWWQVPPQK